MKTYIKMLISVSIIIILIETIMNIFNLGLGQVPLPHEIGIPHPIYNHALRPNYTTVTHQPDYIQYHTTNSLGLRNEDIDYNKSRILMLGDSFAYGQGVELNHTVAKQFESKLDNVQVINAGIPTFETVLEYLLLIEHFNEIQPDEIILLFDWTDIMDIQSKLDHYIYENGTIIKVKPIEPIKKSIIRYILSKSRIIRTSVYSIRKNTGFYNKSYVDVGNNITDIRYYFRDETIVLNSTLKKAITFNQKYILKIKEYCIKQGIPFIMVIYPHGMHIKNQWKSGRNLLDFNDKPTYTTRMFDMMESFTNQNNITLINTLTIFQQHENETLFNDIDFHMTKQGYGLIANEIYEYTG